MLYHNEGLSSLLMSSHMQDEVVFVFTLLMANGTLELGLHATLESNVPIKAVRPGI